MAQFEQILLKKKHGQHFLTASWVVEQAIAHVSLSAQSGVLEIGGGAGFLTSAILQNTIGKLVVFEIDPEWAGYLQKKFEKDISAGRLQVREEDFLKADLASLPAMASWTVLANLPYNISFPILHRFVECRQMIQEGVIMVQEEVAQKIVKTRGRGYGAVSLFFQYHFEWELLGKVPPSAFNPPPKVFSRLMYFRPRQNLVEIPQADEFWKFVRLCFKFPRRTLRNNLAQTHHNWQGLDQNFLNLRAQQLDLPIFLEIWQQLNSLSGN